MTIIKRRKLKWYGQVSRSSGLAKTILQRHGERGKKTDRKRGGKTASRNGQAWSSPSPRRAVENRKTEDTDCGVIFVFSTTPAVKG